MVAGGHLPWGMRKTSASASELCIIVLICSLVMVMEIQRQMVASSSTLPPLLPLSVCLRPRVPGRLSVCLSVTATERLLVTTTDVWCGQRWRHGCCWRCVEQCRYWSIAWVIIGRLTIRHVMYAHSSIPFHNWLTQTPRRTEIIHQRRLNYATILRVGEFATRN